MLRTRLATAAVAIPLLLLLIKFAPLWLFAGFVGIVAAVGVLEYFAMAFPTQTGARLVGIAIGWLLVAAMIPTRADCAVCGVVTSFILGLTWTLLGRRDFEKGLSDLGLTLLGAYYVGVLLPFFVWLWATPSGPGWVIGLLAAVMAGDSSGYFVGHAIGRHKLTPRISPGKTIEGSLGIVAGSMIGVALAKAVLLPIMALSLGSVSWSEALGVAVAIGIIGQIGDLCESMMKRTFATKESGRIFPGHGGVLDRIDSLVFPVALLYYYLTLVH